MRKLFMLAVLTMFAVGISFAQTEQQQGQAGGGDVKQQIMQWMDAGREAALKGDTSWSEKHMADDFVGVSVMGERINGKSEAVSRMKEGKIKYQTIDVQDRDVRVHGDSAIYIGRARLKATRDGKDISGEYLGTWIWAKQGGEWKLVASQSTRAMEPAAASK